MAEVLNLFPARVRFVNDDGTLTAEAYRALQTLTVRVGGSVAPTINDLDVQQYADAGIEETRAMLFSWLDSHASAPPAMQLPSDEMVFPPTAWQVPTDELPLPPLDLAPLLAGLDASQAAPVPEFSQLDQLAGEVAELRETVAMLQTEINNLKQGTLL